MAFKLQLSMNILIVGNGFDLSHYLPTKYDHFMEAMQAVQNWDVTKGDMQFDDLFSSLYVTEGNFFGYTKAMYDTSAVKLTVAEIENLKEQLEQNVWYQYFLQHVREVKTWIDFEKKMGEALEVIAQFFEACHSCFEEKGFIPYRLVEFKKISGINNRKLGLLICLDVILSENDFEDFGLSHPQLKNFFQREEEILNPLYFVGGSNKNGFSFADYQSHLMRFHKFFTEIFNSYLILINKFEPIQDFVKPIDKDIERVYSFNYTSTAQNFYGYQDIEYMHGRIGTNNTMVLGVSDLDEMVLKNFKMYGFTKYHQKLLKNTDYLFLREFIHRNNKIYNCSEEINLLFDNIGGSSDNFYKARLRTNKKRLEEELEKERMLVLNQIVIWGHSLDVSDQEYIKEIFSFNTGIDQQVRVKVFYFNDQAKFDLLSNLLHILGKEKVETWMKNKWLIFEPNPNIAELNGITPVDLSGYHNTASS